MSHFNFVIPLQRDDLFEATTRQQYVVDNVYNMRDLKIKLQDITISLNQQGADFVLFEGFDVIFSLLGEYNKNATVDMKNIGLELTMKGMQSLVDQLAVLLNSKENIETDERIKNLNKMKMMLYLFCQLIQKVETEQGQHDPLTGGKQKGRKKSKEDDYSWDWEQERIRGMTLLYNLVQLNLNQLFEPPIIEDEVLSIIGSTLFKILENPSLAHVKSKDVRLSVIQILGTINKRFNYTLSCSLKFVQQLKHFEHLVSIFSQATEVLVREYGLTGMVLELVREISRVDSKELSRDTSGTRAYSQFLAELAERIPEYIRPCVSLLTAHLDGDSYSMRKCVLAVLGEIVMKVLTKEDMTDADRDDRDSFLECLQDHIHDVHAHVRSHALQIWAKLCTNKCIPLTRQHQILELAVGRLMDKSSNVRKAAVQLLNTLLQSNPFAAKLQTEDLEERLAEEKTKLAALEPETELEPVEQWNMLKGEVEEGMGKPVKKSDSACKVWESACVGELNHRIAGFLDKKEGHRALNLLRESREMFPQEELYKLSDDESMDEDENSDKEEDDEDERNKEMMKELLVLKKVYLEAKKPIEPSLSQSQNNNQEEVSKQKMLVQYLTDSVKFSKIIQKSLPTVAVLLGSKQTSDIQEAIEFFVSAFEFGMMNAMLGVKKMLTLIWSRESSIKDAVVAAYKRLYINVDATNARAASVTIARNLVALVRLATLGELESLEKLIAELVESKDIGKGVFTVLWEFFTGVLPGSTIEDAHPAIMLIRMCACSEVNIISSNLQLIIEHGLGEKGENNFQLAHQSCNSLLKLVPAKLKQDDPDPPFKFKSDHLIFSRMEKLLVDGLYNKLDPHYMPMAKSIIKLVYQLGEGPDTFMGNVVKQICGRVQKDKPELGEQVVPVYVLSRLCFLVGEISLNHLNYLDVNVFNELKRRNYLREEKMEKDKKAKKAAEKKNKRLSVVRSTALSTPAGASVDDDESLVGAEADDAEADFIRKVCEKEMLQGGTLLNCFTPLLLSICSNPTKYKDSDLRCSASMALCKYMLLSSEFADQHLRLIFTMLEKDPEPIIRANLIIALGDLSNKFPNNLEPWTPKMYARLHDDSIQVRKNTLTVLTRLILNDMIKVKGQISDMAFCIVDDIDKISALAKIFFAELAKKGNTLYNVMPDIVSRLSDPEVGIAEENFRTIMRYIIGLIEKDKLLESLVEKLCHRFRATRTRRQWRDIAFCLSLFNYSERAFKKLNENFACWCDKLHEDSVYDSFSSIFSSLRKGAGQGPVGASRVEVKQLLDELEAKVEEARAKGVEDDTADKRAAEARAERCKKKGKKGRKADSSDDEVEIEVQETGERRKSSRRSAAKPKKVAEESEEEEDEEDEEEEEEDEDGEDQEEDNSRGKKKEDKKKKKESDDEQPENRRRKDKDQEETPVKGRKEKKAEELKKKKSRVIDSEEDEEEEEPKRKEETPAKGKKEQKENEKRKNSRVVESADDKEESRKVRGRNIEPTPAKGKKKEDEKKKKSKEVASEEEDEEPKKGGRGRETESSAEDSSQEREKRKGGKESGEERLKDRKGRKEKDGEEERVRSRSRREEKDRKKSLLLSELDGDSDDFLPDESMNASRRGRRSKVSGTPAPSTPSTPSTPAQRGSKKRK